MPHAHLTITDLLVLAATEGDPFTVDLLAVLVTAAVLAIVGQRVKLPIVPAYLITGALVGPHALGLVHSPESLAAIGHLAIILLLFGIGMDLNFAVLKFDLTRMVSVGVGSCALTTALAWPIGVLVFGLTHPAALTVGMAVSLSSTAVVLSVLAQRRELGQTRGRLAFSILIVQDLLVVVMLLALPALATWAAIARGEVSGPETDGSQSFLVKTAIQFVALAAIVGLGRTILPRLLSESARSRNTESMMVLAVAVAIGAAVVTQSVGFSPELGAFLAGLLLSTTPFRHQLRAQIGPLRTLFIAVFFTTVGMQLDPAVVLDSWYIVGLGLVILVVVKAVGIALTSWALGATAAVAIATGLALAQAGEFSLVLLGAARQQAVLREVTTTNGIAIVVLSLIVTPGLMRLGHVLSSRPGLTRAAPWFRTAVLKDPEPTAGPGAQRKRRVVIAGFGPVGRAVAEQLDAADTEVTIVDLNPATIRNQAQLGKQVVYGDIADPEIQEAAGVHEADALVITIPDEQAAVRAAALARQHAPDIFIAARTNIVSQGLRAMQVGADHVTIEELATAESMQKAVISRLLSTPAKPDAHPGVGGDGTQYSD